MHNTVEQLNKMLTPYDYRLLLIDCGCAASRGLMLAIACGFLVVNLYWFCNFVYFLNFATLLFCSNSSIFLRVRRQVVKQK